MNDIEFRPCYRCGGKVTEDFLGRIRCTKCGYDFRTMTVDPDFEPEEDVCEFCNVDNYTKNEFGDYYVIAEEYWTSLMMTYNSETGKYGLVANGDYSPGVDINFCPICGRKLTESGTE